MPRKPRIMSSTGIYHIILRSVNQHIIFEEESDYQKFLYVLSDCKRKYDIKIYAYCLMDNHIHVLLNSPADKLSGFFQSLGSRFVRWYNNKYQRSGHLFQERFYSTIIEDERALEIFRSVTGLSSTSALINVNKLKRNEFVRTLRKKGLTVRQVARLMDISETTIKRLCKMDH